MPIRIRAGVDFTPRQGTIATGRATPAELFHQIFGEGRVGANDKALKEGVEATDEAGVRGTGRAGVVVLRRRQGFDGGEVEGEGRERGEEVEDGDGEHG